VIPASAAALGLLAVLRPHLALIALAVAVPCAIGLGLASPDQAGLFAAATAAGALVAAMRPRNTALRAQRPDIMVPAIAFGVATAGILGVRDTTPIVEGLVLSLVSARHARDGVRRPAHLIGAAVGGGVVTLVVGRPAAGGGIGAVAVGFSLTVAFLAVAALLWTLTAIAMRMARGFQAHPRDPVLAGGLAAIGASIAWLLTHPFDVRPELLFPFWMLLGATIARADGDAQPPLASA